MFGEVTLFSIKPLPAVDLEKTGGEDLVAKSYQKLKSYFPLEVVLTPEERAAVALQQEARLVLGAAGSAPLLCAGKDCPFAKRCPLLAIDKAPLDKPCPFESHYVIERFNAWMLEFERTLETLTESERVTISTLVYLDLQEQRCNQALAEAEDALMRSRSVRDVDVQTGQPVCWEDVLHINAQRLNDIIDKRRMLMKDYELTPEQKTKKARLMGKKIGSDFSSQSASKADLLRKALKREPTVIEVKPA